MFCFLLVRLLHALLFRSITWILQCCMFECDPSSFKLHVVMVCCHINYLMSFLSLLSIARHLVVMALCLTSHAVSQGMKSRAISLCLRTLSRASSAPKWRMVRDESDFNRYLSVQCMEANEPILLSGSKTYDLCVCCCL